MSCILSKFYIKPQLGIGVLAHRFVVSYRNSTSNHNLSRHNAHQSRLYLIEILHQTTTNELNERIGKLLYLIEILHQTTTTTANKVIIRGLYLIEILHQTTTSGSRKAHISGCILSKFYIKPQPGTPGGGLTPGCILSKFYIKPQQRADCLIGFEVVSYRNSTSNHNYQ